MCGLIGFFVGCDLQVACPKRKTCASANAYRSPLKNWDTKASVRNRPSRVEEVNLAQFPEKFVPTLKHKLVKQLDDTSKEYLKTSALFRFLNFTHKLELLVVNTVTANIALGRYNSTFSDQIRLDAHRIYADEAYHGLFSFELMKKMNADKAHGTRFHEDMPASIRRLEPIVTRQDRKERILLELFAVIISEMLITGTLHEANIVPGVDEGVSKMLSDHASDEARHHAFYKQVLFHLWPQLSSEHQTLVVDHVYSLLTAYTAPDREALQSELRIVGLSAAQALQVVEETYSIVSVGKFSLACAEAVLSTFRQLTSPEQSEKLQADFLQTVA